MIKKIIITACLFLSLVSFAQEGTSSPYSFYGIGDIKFKGTVETRSMGGVAVEQDSIHINLENPASYANLKLTSFTIGGTYNTTGLKTKSESARTTRTTLDYLAVGLPLGKFGVGFGLIPYSSVGYKIESISTDNLQNSRRFNGKGGLNKAFLGIGYKIAPNFNIGADVNYNFGKIQTNSLEFIPNITAGTSEFNSADLSGVNFNIGMMYQTKINKKISIFSSVNYTLQGNLTSQNIRNVSTVTYDSNFNLQIVDELGVQKNQTDITLPSRLSVSAGIGESKKWIFGGKIAYQKNSGQQNYYNISDNVSYGRYGSVSMGGYYIPNYNSFNSYAKRVVYRGGLRYEKTGLMVNSQSINDMALTLGVGMPLNGTFSNVNIGFELGKKGTTSSNLVQENYANLSIGFSFNDTWFVKRKFN